MMTRKTAVRGVLGAGVLALGVWAASFGGAPAQAKAAAAAVESECGSDVGVSSDAAYCSTGGWSYVGCCNNSYSKWRRNGVSKCCGACMKP